MKFRISSLNEAEYAHSGFLAHAFNCLKLACRTTPSFWECSRKAILRFGNPLLRRCIRSCKVTREDCHSDDA